MTVHVGALLMVHCCTCTVSLGRAYHFNISSELNCMDTADEEEEFAVPCTNRHISVNRSMPVFDKENQGELAH